MTFAQEFRIISLMKLDYSLQTIEERKALVEEILRQDPNPSRKYLEILGDYLAMCMSKEEKNEKKILTDNRLVTVNKREVSYEGLTAKFENGEDGVYNILNSDRSIIFRPKVKITDEDRAEIPELAQCQKAIDYWTAMLKTATGKDAFIAKKALIEARKEQYSIKSGRKPVVGRGQHPGSAQPKVTAPINLDGYITFSEEGYCVPHGVTLVDPNVCSAILCNYSSLRQAADSNHDSDLWRLLEEFDDTVDRALRKLPLYRTLMECKIADLQNIEIQQELLETYGMTHSLEYISSLWRKKIPDIIASQAEDDYLYWYYTEKERGKWKRCSRCGQIKLAHNKYFSKNGTSKDGFYSICKKCRNKKQEEAKLAWILNQ